MLGKKGIVDLEGITDLARESAGDLLPMGYSVDRRRG
jgi:hypothetical protein